MPAVADRSAPMEWTQRYPLAVVVTAGLLAALVGCGASGAPGTSSPDLSAALAPDLSTSQAAADLSIAAAPDLAAEGPLDAGPDDADVVPDFAGVPASGCNGILACIQVCKGKPMCAKGCEAQATKAGRKLYADLQACVAASCSAGLADGGLGDGGGAPCAKAGSKECQLCHAAAVSKDGPCATAYDSCRASLP